MNGDMAPPPDKTQKRQLAARVLSAFVLAPPVLVATYYGQPYFDILVSVTALILSWEWGRLCKVRPLDMVTLGVVLLAAIAATALHRPIVSVGILVAGSVVILTVATLGADDHVGGNAATGTPHQHMWLVVGTFYIGFPLIALDWLRTDPEWGRNTIYWLFAVVWASDTGAFLVGRMVGGPRLAPAVSPNKTWAGLVGGVACAGAAGAATAAVLGKEELLPMGIISAGMGIMTQVGDLVESWVKRRFQIKDTSNIIPGHGGLFDRIDGLMAAAFAWTVIDLVRRGLWT